MRDKVQLHVAVAWDCDACGRENFNRVVIKTLGEEAQEKMGLGDVSISGMEEMGLPKRVKCRHCAAEYDTNWDLTDADPNERKAVLRPAAIWDCDRCGQENFARLTLVPMSEEEQHRENGVVRSGLEKAVPPRIVKCQYCETEFDVETDAA